MMPEDPRTLVHHIEPSPSVSEREPKGLSEIMRRSMIMLENIQTKFLDPNGQYDPREVKSALASATPLIKLLIQHAPALQENRYAVMEECMVEALKEADEQYKTSFMAILEQLLEARSISLIH